MSPNHHWQCAQDTHRGNLRQKNEDAVYSSAANGIWLVADGMGGHNAGEYASESIARSLAEVTLHHRLTDCVDAVEDRLLEVNDHLRQHARLHCDGQTVGSTVVVLIVRDGVGVVLWAGDSRLYRSRQGRLELLTRDHNPVADLYEIGGVSEAEMLATDTNVITRAVGGQTELHLDIAAFDIEPGDTMMLCSDGLYREVDHQDLCAAMQEDVDRCVTQLMRKCLRGAARDNVSLVVARAGAGL
ncbi:MAG: protein phosphatase 2C domain-containing protein [Pseudomonadota bacterium]